MSSANVLITNAGFTILYANMTLMHIVQKHHCNLAATLYCQILYFLMKVDDIIKSKQLKNFEVASKILLHLSHIFYYKFCMN